MSWNTAAWQDLGSRKTITIRTMTSDFSERSCSELQKSTILTRMESWLSAGVDRLSPGNALAVGCGHLHDVLVSRHGGIVRCLQPFIQLRSGKPSTTGAPPAAAAAGASVHTIQLVATEACSSV